LSSDVLVGLFYNEMRYTNLRYVLLTYLLTY